MTVDYKTWREKTDTNWLFDECKNVGKYMLVPIDQDDDGKILQAISRKVYSPVAAVKLLKSMKVLYKIQVIEAAPPTIEKSRKPFTHRRTRGYLIRGVW